jgi:hypothetical protein
MPERAASPSSIVTEIAWSVCWRARTCCRYASVWPPKSSSGNGYGVGSPCRPDRLVRPKGQVRIMPRDGALLVLHAAAGGYSVAPKHLRECGRPAGSDQRSPALTSATDARPSASSTMTRQLPYVMTANFACWCQCISRMPPADRCMFTPEIVDEILKSDCVTWRAQPPFWARLDAMLNEFRDIGMPPTSVGGMLRNDGPLPLWVGHYE